MDSDSAWRLLLLVILIIMSAFFSAVETAFLSLNRIRLRGMVKEKVKGAENVWKLLESPDKLRNAIIVADNSVNIAATVIAVQLALRHIGKGWSAAAIIGMILIILIFGELFPNLIAEINPEKFSFKVSGLIEILIRILNPIITVLMAISNLIIRIFGWKTTEKTPHITEEELRTLVDVGHLEGVIDPEEKRMIHNVFEFADSQVKDIMIPRTDIAAIDVKSGYDEIWDRFRKERYSRMPVYENSIDNIVGVLHVKDLFFYNNSKDAFDIRQIIRKPYFTYENKRIVDLFEEMRKKRLQMIIVVDEYGGTAGIVTMQDMVEEIFGDIGDEHDDIIDEIQQISPTEYIIDGLTRLNDLNEELGTSLESEHYETIGGFITGIIGRFPKKGEVVVYNNLRWLILDVYRTRVKRLKLSILDSSSDSQSNHQDTDSK